MADVNEKLTESENLTAIKSAAAAVSQHDDNKFKLSSRAALMQVNIGTA